jgi:hypothetical protein
LTAPDGSNCPTPWLFLGAAGSHRVGHISAKSVCRDEQKNRALWTAFIVAGKAVLRGICLRLSERKERISSALDRLPTAVQYRLELDGPSMRKERSAKGEKCA